MANANIKAIITAEDRASGALKGFAGKIDDLGSSIANAAKKASIALGAGITAAAGFAVKATAEYEKSLNIFESVSNATGEQMKEVAARARELGKDISLPGISAKDAAAAMVELSKAGLSVNDTLSASKGVLSLAKAGNLETAYAAEVAANALNAFALKGSEATRVADMLAAAANASSADVQDIALGMQMASSSAASMKVPIDDLITALAQMSNNAIKGSDAGTSLKTFLMNMVPVTVKAKTAMKKLNLDFFDAKGNFIGLRKVTEQLQNATKHLSDEQRSLAFEVIFGSDSVRAANVLAKEGVEGFDRLSKSVNEQGAASKLAAAQNKGFTGALDNLKSVLETLAIDIGVKILPPLTNFLRILADKIDPTVKFITETFAENKDMLIQWVNNIKEVGRQIAEYLGPKLEALWNTLNERLFPALYRLWKEVLEPLIPVIGTALVVALGLTIDAVNLLVTAFSGIVNFLLDHEYVFWLIVGVLGAIRTALFLNGALAAFQGVIAGATSSFAGLKALIATPMVMPAIVIAAALASLNEVRNAVNAIKGAIDAMNAAANAQASMEVSNQAAERRLRELIRTGTPEQQARARRALSATGVTYATGGFTGQGGTNEIAGMVHKGEYVIPKQFVDQNSGLPKMGGSTINLNVNVGMYAGTPMERRKLAETLWSDLQDIANQRNMKLGPA